MLIEIKGKIYEINNIFLFLVFILVISSVLYLAYLGVSSASRITTITAEPADTLAGSSAAKSDKVGLINGKIQESIKQNTKEDPCYMGGRGRIAKKIGTRYNCRSTENLMMMKTDEGTIVCCVVP